MGQSRTRVGIKEIAKRAGVSISTVSRILNDPDKKVPFAPKTRKRVLEVCKANHYYPNAAARGLVMSRTSNILFVSDELYSAAAPYHSLVLSGAAHLLEKSNYYVQLASTLENTSRLDKTPNYLRAIREGRVDGGLFFGERIKPGELRQLISRSFPFVFVNFRNDSLDMVPSVMADAFDGGIQAARVLKRGRYEKYYFLSLSSSYSQKQKLAGFQKGLDPQPVIFVNVDESGKAPLQKLRNILKRKSHTAGFFLSIDEFALPLLEILSEAGLSVPGEAGIVGYNDVSWRYTQAIGLTTIRVPAWQMGYKAADLLLKIISGKKIRRYHYVLPVSLIQRDTTF